MGRSLRAQMKAADRMRARFTLVLGETEVEEAKGKLRRLDDGEETETPLAAIGGLLETK